jgi:alanyl-tRNA synthetase
MDTAFMEFNRKADGSLEKPQHNTLDTGMDLSDCVWLAQDNVQL